MELCPVKETKGFSLVELCMASMLGIILMIATTFVVVWIFKMQIFFQQRANDDMSWITANEHLKKNIHGSSYVKLSGGDLELHNYDGTVKGTYVGLAVGLQFSDGVHPATIFKNVNATFASVYSTPSPGNKVLEVRVNYTSPSQLSSSLVLKCGVDLANTWAKTFGSGPARSVQQTTDKGYIIAGTTSAFGAGGSDIYLIKIDSNGTLQWSKTFGGSSDDFAESVQQTTDGGYIIAGSTTSFGAGTWDVYIIKTDSSGTAQWSKTFGDPESNFGYSAQQTTDGGYIIGETAYSGTGSFCLIKTDSSGNASAGHGWSKTVTSGWPVVEGDLVQQTTDGGYIMIGRTTDAIWDSNSSYTYLIKTDSSGNELWWYSSAGGRCAYSGQQTTDGGYIIAGQEAPNGTLYPGGDVYVAKIDSSRMTQWEKTFGGSGNDIAYSVKQTVDGGYIMAGATTAGSSGLYLIKINSSGTLQWSKTFGGSGDYAYSVQQTTDKGYIIAGHTDSFGAPWPNGYVYLIKTDSNGNCADSGSPTHDPSVPTPG